MAIIKLLARFYKESGVDFEQQIKDELEFRSLIQGDNFNEELELQKLKNEFNKSYDYLPVVFDLKDVAISNKVDEEHTCLRFYTGTMFTFKIPIEKYEEIYQKYTNIIIIDCTNQ